MIHLELVVTEPPLIIDPRNGKEYNFDTDDHDFKHMPPALFKVFWWATITQHESVNWSDDEAVMRVIEQFSVRPGSSPRGQIGNDLFDAYSACGGQGRDFPHRVRAIEVDHYKDQLKHL